MNNTELLRSISFKLSSVAKCTVRTEWNYSNIISSFTRLYLITEGEAYLCMGEKRIDLKKGYLYLVPSFLHCSYVCPNEMTHYYATFSMQLPNSLSLYQLFNFSHEIKATPEHETYFKRLYKENPNMALPANDPNIYQRINSKIWNYGIKDAQRSLSSSGLLYLLMSEFIGTPKINFEKGESGNILSAMEYIHAHLNKELSVRKLAEIACLSTGHFTRKFKHLTQLTPLDYLNKQRIEQAQLLLNTTSQSCIEIAEACGYKSNAYFSKIFKKYIGQAPGEYRKNQI